MGFIGDNTHSILQKQKLAKFQKEYKNYANTKKRTLLESIRLAKEMIDNKGKPEDLERMKKGVEDRISANNISKAKAMRECKFKLIFFNLAEMSEEESEESDEDDKKKNKIKKVPPKDEKEQKDFTKSKRKRTDDKKESKQWNLFTIYM